MAEWNPDVYQCKHCRDLVYSMYPGQFRACSCFENKADNKGIAVDQTREYLRLIGDIEDNQHKGKLSDN